MVSSPINSLVNDINVAVSTVQKKYNVSDTTVDFGKHFDKASQDVKKSYENSKGNVSAKNVSEIDNTNIEDKTKFEDDFERSDDFSKGKVSDDEGINKDAKSTEKNVDEELNKEISEVLSQIIEQIKSILGISDEEFADAMENIGIQSLDLFDLNNVPQLIMTITGAESNISFVADEEMYLSLQEVLQVVEEGLNSLMEDNGLTDGELTELLQEMKMLNETDSEEIVQVLDDDFTLGVEKSANEESTKEIKMSVDSSQNNVDSEAEVKSQVETSDTEETVDKKQNEKRDFTQQNGFANNFENGQNEINKLSSENDVTTYSTQDTEKIMRQIVDMMKVVKNEQLTEMELQLHPASLGNVKVTLATKGGAVTAEFITQNEAVKNAIEAQAVQLKANLEEQGVKIEAIEVSVASHQMERNLEQDNKNGSQNEREQDEKYVQGIRKNNINFNSFEDGEELLDELNSADDATRIAMEMMAVNGNSMDIMA